MRGKGEIKDEKGQDSVFLRFEVRMATVTFKISVF
jgi:hypothetical protein